MLFACVYNCFVKKKKKKSKITPDNLIRYTANNWLSIGMDRSDQSINHNQKKFALIKNTVIVHYSATMNLYLYICDKL